MSDLIDLIVEPPGDGQRNMAIDAELLRLADEGRIGPTLRLYGWSRPTLSVGRHQSMATVDEASCARRGIPIVRRPTGGRAVFHDDELTYAVILPASSRFHGALDAIYRFVAGPLGDLLTSLGLTLDPAASTHDAGNPGCFSGRTRYELSVGGMKIAGSAQRRLRWAALQHGSILMTADRNSYRDLLVWRNAAERAASTEGFAGINDLLDTPVSRDRMADALIDAFERRHGLRLAPAASPAL